MNRVCTPSSPVRERERKGEIARERERCPEMLFLFLKGMRGALAPFSYLVYNNMLELGAPPSAFFTLKHQTKFKTIKTRIQLWPAAVVKKWLIILR